jgi:hypothetical protein
MHYRITELCDAHASYFSVARLWWGAHAATRVGLGSFGLQIDEDQLVQMIARLS